MDDRDFSYLLSRKCKRKEIRKTSKKVKKAAKVAFSKHQKVADAVEAQLSNKKTKKRAKRKKQAEKKQQKLLEQEEEPQELEAFLKEAAEVRKGRMLEELDDDDAEIQRLEKKLSSRKRKRDKTASASDDDDDKILTEKLFDDEDGDVDFGNLDKISSDVKEESGSEKDSAMEKHCAGSKKDEDFFEGELDTGEYQQADEEVKDSLQALNAKVMNFDPALLKLANKAKMNSETQQNVFCTIMSSEKDTAFERLQKLRLAGPQEREIVRVCVECALLECQYNQFYVALVSKFCCSHPRFLITTQYVLWDVFKNIESLKQHKQQNLAYFVADLFKFQAIGLSVLRVMDFSNVSQPVTTLLKRIFYYFFTSSRDSVIRDAFLRVINSSKKKNYFSEALQRFFEQPVADIISISSGENQLKEMENLEIFKKRLALVKRLWSVI